MDVRPVRIALGDVALDGDLGMPRDAPSIVVFVHGSGSSRHSPRNRQVAATLNSAGHATLLFDLLTTDEEAIDERTRALRFDIGLLAQRLQSVTRWLGSQDATAGLRVGYFGASTGAAAALVAAGNLGQGVGAVVSRGGRPDLAGDALPRVACPVLLVVGSLDQQVLELNRQAASRLGMHDLEIIEGAGHLFSEPGSLEQVADLAAAFFTTHLGPALPGPRA